MKSLWARVRGNYSGFTLLEILIVVTILGILLTVLYLSLLGNTAKARDARRKSDLNKLKVKMEDYNNENGKYPTNLDPTLCHQQFGKYGDLPCDPINNGEFRYKYVTDARGSMYKIYTRLEYDQDPVISAVGCDPEGCEGQTVGPTGLNWGVSSPNVSLAGCPVGWFTYGCQSGACNSVQLGPPTNWQGDYVCQPDQSCGGDCCNGGC